MELVARDMKLDNWCLFPRQPVESHRFRTFPNGPQPGGGCVLFPVEEALRRRHEEIQGSVISQGLGATDGAAPAVASRVGGEGKQCATRQMLFVRSLLFWSPL